MSKSKIFALVNTLTLIITLVINALANILPINGRNTGEVSSLYPNLFTPSGYTFSIWTVIYALLIAFVVYHWRSVSKNKNTKLHNDLSPLFIVSCFLNALWIITFHYLLIGLSVVIMLAFLIILIRIFIISQQHATKTKANLYLIQIPFTIYLAWICVATIANISAHLTSINWTGGFMSEELWTVTMMSVAALLAAVITMRFKVPGFSLVVIWAIGGILMRWINSDYSLITYTSVVLIIILFFVMIKSFLSNRKVYL